MLKKAVFKNNPLFIYLFIVFVEKKRKGALQIDSVIWG